VELFPTTADGTAMTPAPVDPDTTGFARMQDRMRSAATGETPADSPAAPPKRAEADPAGPPRRSRPRKDPGAKPRTTVTAKAAPAAPAADVDYTKGAQSLVGNVWLGLAMLPPTQPYAAVLSAGSDGLAAALAEGAKHNDTIRSWVDGGTDSMWKLQLAGAVVTMGVQCFHVARDPKLRAEAQAATREQLGKALAAQGITLPAPAEAQAGADTVTEAAQAAA
jgi:hypothetical protein